MTEAEREQFDRFNALAAAIEDDIYRIESIYPSIDMYDEPCTRLAQRIAHKLLEGEYSK